MKCYFFIGLFLMMISGCSQAQNSERLVKGEMYKKPLLLNYQGTPQSEKDKDFLMYSDQGAWFAYSLPQQNVKGGFSGPFLMTQDNGIWSSKSLVKLQFLNEKRKEIAHWDSVKNRQQASLGHLKFSYENPDFKINQQLFYPTSRTAAIKVVLTNISDKPKKIYPLIQGSLLPESLSFENGDDGIQIKSTTENTTGYLRFPADIKPINTEFKKKDFSMEYESVLLAPGENYEFIYTQSFLFPEDNWEKEGKQIAKLQNSYDQIFGERNSKKQKILEKIKKNIDPQWRDSIYSQLAEKLVLTLQNNWRTAAGGLEHAGLFPSYHYQWFQGFWAWDSWKHAAALAVYNPKLAKEQVMAMYDYQTETGFIPDCMYRNNLIEENNYRDTKPPLSGWSVWSIYKEDKDLDFLRKIYPKIKKQHEWWYQYRDHDKDGICEYGSTDGSLIAAKWESGMDNAVRFDASEILKNSESAFSLNQESVDLNSYLYAEKIYLAKMADLLHFQEEKNTFLKEAAILKENIQTQFYDEDSGWFYDTNLDGTKKIKAMGSEGWIPLWAEVASQDQANKVQEKMMDPRFFNTTVPLQTLSASHKDFKPDGGYWRGPTWIDQAYFGIRGLKNYGFDKEADSLTYKLFHNADGVLKAGESIRENYDPITGKGLEAENFSWSAAHFLLLLLNK